MLSSTLVKYKGSNEDCQVRSTIALVIWQAVQWLQLILQAKCEFFCSWQVISSIGEDTPIWNCNSLLLGDMSPHAGIARPADA